MIDSTYDPEADAIYIYIGERSDAAAAQCTTMVVLPNPSRCTRPNRIAALAG